MWPVIYLKENIKLEEMEKKQGERSTAVEGAPMATPGSANVVDRLLGEIRKGTKLHHTLH